MKTVDDRNMNMVLIIESPSSTLKTDGTRNDLNNSLSMLSTKNSSIQNASIHDLRKLDSNQSQSRPILARRMDVTTIPSNRNKVKRPIVIKAEYKRKVESMLLQEHWKLIQKGTIRKHITIQKAEKFVGKLLYAKVIDQKLRSLANTTDYNLAPSTSGETDMEQVDDS